MMFRKLFFLVYYSIKEFFLSRVFYIVIFFLFFSFFISAIVTILAVGDEKKVLGDFLAAACGMAVLIFSIIYPPIGISSEIETKRIYLILSKSVSRSQWFISKLIAFICISIILLLSINIINLIFFFVVKGYFVELSYFKYLATIFLKTSVLVTISMSLSLITSSQYSTMLISTMIWIGAHFAKELKQSLVHIKSLSQYLLYTVYLLPDFSNADLNIPFLIHCLIYSLAWFYLGLISFKDREL